MRITQKVLNNSVMLNLNHINNDRQKYYNQLSTQKRINNPSDDPAGTAKVIQLNQLLSQYANYQKNIDDAKGFLTATEASLNAVNENIQQSITIGLQGASDTSGEDARSILADQVDYIIERVMAESNRQYGTKYIFGGTAIDEQPFEMNDDGSISMTNTSAINGKHVREVMKGDTVQINFSGQDVFMGENGTFESLIELRDALRANDADSIQAATEKLKTVNNNITRFTSVAGLRYEHVTNMEQTLANFNLQMEALRSSIEDADIAEASIKYEESNTIYQANLQFSSSILEMSLLDYLA